MWLRRLGRTALGVAGLLVTIVVLVALTRPWAVTALWEGMPAATWPSGGDHASQPGTQTPIPVTEHQLVATDEFAADAERANTTAVLVVDDGQVVYSEYAEGYGPDTAFNSFSMVKSLVAVLTLKAVSDGRVDDLDVTVGELWADSAGTDLAPVPIRDLLDMRSGLSFERPPGMVGEVETDKTSQVRDFSPLGPLARLHVQGPDEVAVDVRLIEADRGMFSYQQLNTSILGRVLEEVHGRPLDEILHDELVEPAGAGDFRWRQHPGDGRITAYCCLYATAEWWATILIHLADNGGPDPILTPHWFDYFVGADLTDEDRHVGHYRSQIHYDILDRDGEQLQGPFLCFAGLDGQMAYLIAHEDRIVVRFGDGYQRLHSTLYYISAFEPS